uniref:Uncharacterized protein n=1 Tax=Sphaerodactylus townsendi TaxID=933632 RepID=A0ACB8EC67_9SAUR
MLLEYDHASRKLHNTPVIPAVKAFDSTGMIFAEFGWEHTPALPVMLADLVSKAIVVDEDHPWVTTDSKGGRAFSGSLEGRIFRAPRSCVICVEFQKDLGSRRYPAVS